MIYQYETRLNKNIIKYGCYFLCLLYVATKSKGIFFSALNTANVNNIYARCLEAGAINEDCYVNDATKAITIMAKQVEEMHSNCCTNIIFSVSVAPADFFTTIKTPCLFIAEWKWKITHFTVMDNKKYHIAKRIYPELKNKIQYDPLENSVTAKMGKIVSTRIIYKEYP